MVGGVLGADGRLPRGEGAALAALNGQRRDGY